MVGTTRIGAAIRKPMITYCSDRVLCPLRWRTHHHVNRDFHAHPNPADLGPAGPPESTYEDRSVADDSDLGARQNLRHHRTVQPLSVARGSNETPWTCHPQTSVMRHTSLAQAQSASALGLSVPSTTEPFSHHALRARANSAPVHPCSHQHETSALKHPGSHGSPQPASVAR